MIKIFRRIRQQLLSENKFSKYLIYAVGEILLVVIGILIALQVNNWNQSRNDKNLELKILHQLTVDLEDNLEEIKGIYNQAMHRRNIIDSIRSYFNQDRALDSLLIQYFDQITFSDIFNSANTTYKYIQNAGVNFISNDSIRKAITEMYEGDFHNITIRQELEGNIRELDLKPYMQSRFRSKNIAVTASGIKLDKEAIYPIDYETLKKDFEFENILLKLKNQILRRTLHLTNTIKDLEALIIDVNSEIKLLKK